MTYCLGIMTREGLVMASDSRANAGFDQVNVCPKMHTFLQPGERAFVILTSGNLSLTQSVITLLRDDFDAGEGLARAETMYAAARVVGDMVRRVSDLDRAALEKDDFKFNIHLLLGGQVKGEKPNLFLIYPQGNPLSATEDSPYLQIGEVKYGRPILDRGIEFESTSSGRCGHLCAALARCRDALQRDRWPSPGSPALPKRQAGLRPLPAL